MARMNFATDAIGIILKEIQKKEKYVCMHVTLSYFLKDSSIASITYFMFTLMLFHAAEVRQLPVDRSKSCGMF